MSLDADAFANSILRVLADGTYFTGDFVKRARQTLQELDVTWDALVDQVEALASLRHPNPDKRAIGGSPVWILWIPKVPF